MALDEWNDPAALAAWLKLPLPTLYTWRHKGIGPPAVKVGKHLRYRRCDVEEWLERQGDTSRAT